MNKISIIIPVYNVEPYIGKCLDSVINQTYTNLEIICVNDGSTDNSGMICDQYARRDKRIKVFHKNNEGVSYAKNLGLKSVTGGYVGFVDSDDWIEPNMYQTLYEAIKDNDVPVSVASYFKDSGVQSIPMVNKESIPHDEITPEDMLLYPLKRDYHMGFCGYLWNKLFAAELFADDSICFDRQINYGEDVLFYTMIVISGKCSGTYIDRPLYHYRQRDTSISKSKSINVKCDILKAYKRIEQLLTANGYGDESYWARGFYCYHASVIAEMALKNNDRQALSLMQNEIREHFDDYVKSNQEFPHKFDRINALLDIDMLRR